MRTINYGRREGRIGVNFGVNVHSAQNLSAEKSGNEDRPFETIRWICHTMMFI